jgi:phage tail sheath protein FI
MAFQLSPGVNVSEVDLTTVVPAVGTTTGALVGTFAWGPANQITLVSSENKLVEIFGKPNNETANDFFTAANFLAYGNSLRLVRANTDSNNATSRNTTGLKIFNDEQYTASYYASGEATYGPWAARYPGTLGNSLKVSVCDSATAYSSWAYKNSFSDEPGTSLFAQGRGATNDEMHIAVIDEDGLITGTQNTVIEVYPFVSKASDAKNDTGASNYYKEVIFRTSEYVHWLGHTNLGANVTNWGSEAALGRDFARNNTANTQSLQGGTLVSATAGNLTYGWDRFEQSETVDVSLLMTSNAEATVAGHVIDLAAARRDCVAFVSPPLSAAQSSDPVSDVVTYKTSTLNRSTSYAVMDSGWKYMYDKYNDVYRWVPLNGDIAGLCVRTDTERDPWFSPAGFNRGQIRNIVKLAFNPSKTQRDELYRNSVNPVTSFPGEGTVLFGDKTLQSKASSFDRINVRRLFIVLEKAISRAARASLFEFNDEFTRSSFVNLIEPFLREVQGRRGIFDFRVVCDATNNTPEVIDRNEFVGDIYIKPTRSINFIQLNFVAVRSGVTFDEIVGRF